MIAIGCSGDNCTISDILSKFRPCGYGSRGGINGKWVVGRRGREVIGTVGIYRVNVRLL